MWFNSVLECGMLRVRVDDGLEMVKILPTFSINRGLKEEVCVA